MASGKESSKMVLKNLDEKAGIFCTAESKQCNPCSDIQLKVFAVTGMGFLAASYDTFNILLLTPLMGRRYFQDLPSFMNDDVQPGRLPIHYEAAIISVLLVGAFIGNLLGGSLADVYGRKALFEASCCILIIFAFLSAFTYGVSGPAVIGSLAFWRFFLGIGIGMMVPLSAITMSEYSSRKSRGGFVAIVFAMQGTGILIAGAVCGIANAGVRMLGPSNDFPVLGIKSFTTCTTAYASCPTADQQSYENAVLGSTPNNVEYVWRCTVAVGAIPAIIALILSRCLLVETPRFTAHVKKDYIKTVTDLAAQGEPYAAMAANGINTEIEEAPESDLTTCGFLYFHGWNLTTVSLCWFLFDIGFYSMMIANRDAITVTGFNKIQKWQSSVDETNGLCKAYVAIVVASLIPGYYAVVLTVDLIGRKLLQFLGFILFAIFLAAIAAGRNVLLEPNNASQYDTSSAGQALSNMKHGHTVLQNGWIVLFILAYFFASFGPLTTTYIIPAELFPTRWRGTGYGIAAAFGTLGSITGIFGFLYASQPMKRETQYAYPCSGSATPTDLTADGSCMKLNFCPIGRTVPGAVPGGYGVAGSECSTCDVRSMAGCADYGIGPAGAMGILVTILIAGAFATLALPLTTQRSLEDINHMNETEPPREFVMFDTFDSDCCAHVNKSSEVELKSSGVMV